MLDPNEKAREKKARLQARVFMKMENDDGIIIEKAIKKIAQSSDMIARINEYSDHIRELIEKRKLQPSRIRIEKCHNNARLSC